jgi:hypothetical protein
MQSVLDNFIKLKQRFVVEYGEDALWNYGEYQNCIEYWSSKFPEFYEMFSPLIVNEHNDLILLRYNLMETDAEFWAKYNGMYRECRSVVLDKKNECLVLTPFRKFFNLNETEETAEKLIRERIAKAKRVEVSDKLDGSMQSARYYHAQFVLAGTRALDPALSYRVSIGYSMLNDNYKRMLMEHPDCTFIFELICKEDQHVVVYSEEQRGLYLIGVRNSITGEQMSYADVIAMAKKYDIKHTKVFNKTFDELLASLDDKNSNEAEGFVIDIDGYKIKLKYNDYLVIHRMLSKLVSTNTIIRCIENGTWDDVRSKMPEAYRADADIVANVVKSYVNMMIDKVNSAYKLCQNERTHSDDPIQDKKLFAMHAIQTNKSIAHYLINKYEGRENNFIRNKAGRYLKYHEIKQLLNCGGD